MQACAFKAIEPDHAGQACPQGLAMRVLTINIILHFQRWSEAASRDQNIPLDAVLACTSPPGNQKSAGLYAGQCDSLSGGLQMQA